MKKSKKIGLVLNKRKVSELSNASQQKIVGGSYPSNCGCGGGGGTASLTCGSRIGNAGCCH